MLHVSSADFIYQGGQVLTGGVGQSYTERYVNFHLTVQVHLKSSDKWSFRALPEAESSLQ